MPYIQVHSARTEDREAILVFCKQTWSWGDYVEKVWGEWLRNPNGQLLVATADSKPVGIVHMQMLDKTSAWLEGIRVDPAYRRQGIARALAEQALLEAMQRGASCARLITELTNEAMIRLAKSMHMRRVGSYAVYSAATLITSSKGAVKEQIRPATQADLDDLINYLNVSSIFPLVGGLYYTPLTAYPALTAYPITAELLEGKIATEQLYVLRRWNRLDGLAIIDTSEGLLGRDRLSLGERVFGKDYLSLAYLGYIDGVTTEAISLLGYDLRYHLAKIGLKRVHVYAPDLVLVHDALGGIGYEPQGIGLCTFERGLV